MNSSANIKTNLIDTLSVSEYIPIKNKGKVKFLDIHQNFPLAVFADEDNNILVIDVLDKKLIRVFNISHFIPDSILLKDLKFFVVNDKQFILNYDLNEIKKIKGIPFQVRSHLLIITLEKQILFYSCITQSFIKTISHVELEQKLPVKVEVYNYLYLVIQTQDGSLLIWNLLDWVLVKVINKTNILKPVSNFIIITTLNEEKLIAVANTNGNIFLIDISKKEMSVRKIDDKTDHDNNVFHMEFNPYTNIISSISKNYIVLIKITDLKVQKKFPNFQYHKSEKAYGVIPNLNQNFSKNTYFIYGKSSVVSSIELKLESLKGKKVEAKDMKNLVGYSFDTDLQNLPKANDKSFKIYTAKLLNHTNDYLILGINKGLIILKFNNLCKSEIVSLPELNELNENRLYFYYILNSHDLIERSFTFHNMYSLIDSNSSLDVKNKTVLTSIFDNKSMTTNFFSRYKISFSHNNKYMATLDTVNFIYTVFLLEINEELKYSLKPIKYGKCSGDLEWCPYDDLFAVTNGSISQISTKSNTDKNKLSNSFKMSFTLSVFKIQGDNVNVLYVVDDIPCHRIFGGHFIGILTNLVKTNSENEEMLTYPGTFSKFCYLPGNELVLNFYSWDDKIKLKFYISEEPKFIFSSPDMTYLVIVFFDRYILYSVSNNEGLTPVSVNYYKIIDAIFYENFILVFLTDKGVFYHILSEENSYPNKLFKASDEINLFHLKISKKIKEKSPLYNNKLLPSKILGIFGSNLALASSFNKIIFKTIDNVLFRLIYVITQRNYKEINSILEIVEKKYVKSVLTILKYYFDKNEEILRKIFGYNNFELVDRLGLQKYESIFLNDYLMVKPNIPDSKQEVDKCLRSWLVNFINTNDKDGINKLYQFSNQNGLPFEIYCSKFIDQNSFLKSMLVHNRNFESYLYNENNRINEGMGEKILNRAFERINQFKAK